jgi:hypothetical protein
MAAAQIERQSSIANTSYCLSNCLNLELIELEETNEAIAKKKLVYNFR